MSPLPSQLFSPASYSRLSHRIIAISIEYDTVSTNTENHIGARWYSLPLRGQDSLSLLPGPGLPQICSRGSRIPKPSTVSDSPSHKASIDHDYLPMSDSDPTVVV